MALPVSRSRQGKSSHPKHAPWSNIMNYPEVVLKPKEEGRLIAGHLWAFSNEIAKAPANAVPGALADLFHAQSGFLGRGFYNPNSLIAFRILSDQKDDEIDGRFFYKRLEAALEFRKMV